MPFIDWGLELGIGAAIGLVLGLTGAGGSVFAVPLIVLCLGIPTNDAIGISLGAVAASSGVGVLTRIKQRNSSWLPALFFALGGVLFAPLGRVLGTQVDDNLLLLLFSLLAIIIAARMWSQANNKDSVHVRALTEEQESNEKDYTLCRFNQLENGHYGPFRLRIPCIRGMVLAGISVGILSGFFGVGGGFLIIPLLMMLTDMSMKQSITVSLLVIFLVSSSGFITFLLGGTQLPLNTLVTISLGGFAGMLIGSLLARQIAGKALQRGFAVSIILLSLASIASSL